MIDIASGVFVFIFGAVIGSFLNVCIHRMPHEQSIVTPGSHCPRCKHPLSAADNVPLISFAVLCGKCRYCKERISPRYFAVELINAAAWTWLWTLYGFTPFFFAGTVFFSLLLAVTITDFETGLIPDLLTLPGMVSGVLMSTVWPVLQNETVWYWGLGRSVLGLLAGGGILLAVGLLGNLIFRKESMGGGDIKLLALVGAFLGSKYAVMVFMMSPMIALPVALYAKIFRKAETIPYGPYLAIMAALFFVYGETIMRLVLATYGV